MASRQRLLSLLLLLQLAVLRGATVAAADPAAPFGVNVTHLNISSFDGTRLPAVLVVPTGLPHGRLAPAVVMANSWYIDSDVEYSSVQHAWAQTHGYASLSYESRGWDGAGGTIAMGGPADWHDQSRVIDVLVHQRGINASALATLGVSLGGGLAVLGAAHDPRIKCALSLSGWGNLTTALYGGDTASEEWGGVLVGSGNMTGHESPVLKVRWQELMQRKNISSVSAWSDVRSPLNYTDLMCGHGRRLPVFISNNAEDRLFKPDAALFYGDKLLVSSLNNPNHNSIFRGYL